MTGEELPLGVDVVIENVGRGPAGAAGVGADQSATAQVRASNRAARAGNGVSVISMSRS